MKYVSLPWPSLEAALSIFDVKVFFETVFGEGIDKKLDCH
jgi:hypothetical protein